MKILFLRHGESVDELILTSPLKRAYESAQVLSQKLKLPLETLEYLKERNKYGLLSGLKTDARTGR